MSGRLLALGLVVLVLAGCQRDTDQAPGTLEYDRITLPAPAAERIVAVHVRAGEAVKAGQPLIDLDPAHTRASLDAALAELKRQQDALAESVAGPRREDIDKARASLAAAEAQARDARSYLQRLMKVAQQEKDAVAASDLDRARANAQNARGQADAARAALDQLLHGTRSEQLAQARAAVDTARAQADALRVTLGKLHVVAPRDGRIDDVPYRLGDQAPVGAPLAIELVGDRPYARIYVPVSLRAQLKVGSAVEVHVQGRAQPLAGHVRLLRAEPVFTPYYALSGDDATRLSYLAEVALDRPSDLPAGLPVHVVPATP
ncbi:MAG: HlyD family efflux transporter periplasmic adaptor subunit [Xanthomonadaceae bacterium]|nr:HlyD family efflux transporter periplasmic adaptor subunit [Xanthomonadaceae bacterium]MDE1962316.1 HlyD family efflux transporter periplasmic adaptor subunit [Xanthomonadaceae bacterium]